MEQIKNPQWQKIKKNETLRYVGEVIPGEIVRVSFQQAGTLYFRPKTIEYVYKGSNEENA